MSIDSHRRGGVLFEVLLSIALFIGAATFTLGTTRTVLVAIDRSAREAIALDLARSKMAELDAGLVTMAELRESSEGIERVGSIELLDVTEAVGDAGPIWELAVTTERTEYSGLTLVEITVQEAPTGAGAEEDDGLARATLRQLVALREDTEEGYEEDALLEGLPAAEDER